ncbi:GumC family protein [Mesorhizobium sp. A556]
MFERENREDKSRLRSLLSLGQQAPERPAVRPSISLLSVADDVRPSGREDAAARHRLARAEREAQSEHVAPPPPIMDEALPPFEPAETVPAFAQADRRPPDREGDDQRWKPLIDPIKVFGGIARSKKLIVAATLAGALLGVAIAVTTPKKYEATTELIADPRDLQITDHDLTQSGIASDTTLAIVENQVRVLTSGTVLNQVADKLNLDDDPEFNGQSEGFPGVMAMIRSVLSRDDAPAGNDEARRRAIVVDNLAKDLSVERGSKTFVISIGVTTKQGEKSALIANTMADVFLQTYGKMQSDTAGRATGELTGRLDELRAAVEAAERKVETFKAEHDLIDAQGRLISDDELVKLNDQLTVARAKTLELNAKAASARSVDVDAVLGGTLPEAVASDAMNDLRAQYAKLRQEADRADVRLGPRHPERLALDAQLTGARDRIAGELRRIASSLQTELKRAVQMEQELSSRLAQLKVRSGDVNADLVTARELERDANAKRAVYEAFLLRAKQTGEQKDINTANISVISKAFPPLEPTGPSRALTALAGLLLGFASGIGLGAMRGAYDSLRETADDRSRQGQPAQRRTPDRAAFAPPPREPLPFHEPVVAEAAPLPSPVRQNPIETLRSAITRALQRKAPGPDESPEEGPEEVYEETDRYFEEEEPGEFDDAPVFAPDDTMQPAESTMYPVYPDPNAPYAPQQPAMGYPQPQFQQGAYPQHPYPVAPPMMPQQAAPYPAPQMQPQPYAPPQQVYAQPQPYLYVQAPQQMAYPPQPQAWQVPSYAPPPAYPYAPPMPQHQAAPYPQPQPFNQPRAPEMQSFAEEPTPIEEIRASLREFRDAVRDLADSRSRRRYF